MTPPTPTTKAILEKVRELQAKMKRIKDDENAWHVIDIEDVEHFASLVESQAERIKELESIQGEPYLAAVAGGKRVWEMIQRKAVLNHQTRTYTVQYTPEEMEVIISMAKPSLASLPPHN